MFSLSTHSLSTPLSFPPLCLPMLYLWTVAKAASLQENQMEYQKWHFKLFCIIAVHTTSTRLLSHSLSGFVAETHIKIQVCALFHPYCGQWYITWQLTDLLLLASWNHGGLHPLTHECYTEWWPRGRGIKCRRDAESSRSGDESGRRITGQGRRLPQNQRLPYDPSLWFRHIFHFIPSSSPWHCLIVFNNAVVFVSICVVFVLRLCPQCVHTEYP